LFPVVTVCPEPAPFITVAPAPLFTPDPDKPFNKFNNVLAEFEFVVEPLPPFKFRFVVPLELEVPSPRI